MVFSQRVSSIAIMLGVTLICLQTDTYAQSGTRGGYIPSVPSPSVTASPVPVAGATPVYSSPIVSSTTLSSPSIPMASAPMASAPAPVVHGYSPAQPIVYSGPMSSCGNSIISSPPVSHTVYSARIAPSTVYSRPIHSPPVYTPSAISTTTAATSAMVPYSSPAYTPVPTYSAPVPITIRPGMGCTNCGD